MANFFISSSSFPSTVQPAKVSMPAISEEEEKSSAVFQHNLPLIRSLSTQPASEISPHVFSKFAPTVLIHTPDFYLIDLPTGKPDPRAPCSAKTLQYDNRPLVPQPASKASTCWYYAYKVIRDLIGKNPAPELGQKRETEKLISDLRKQYTRVAESLPEVFTAALNSDEEEFATWDREKAKEVLFNWDKYKKSYESRDLSKYASLLPELKKFATDSDEESFLEYMFSRVDSLENEIGLKFLQKLNLTPENLYEHERKNDSENHKSFFGTVNWHDLNGVQQAAFLNTYVTYLAARLYKFEVSDWTPFQPIDSLIEALRKSGPHIIGGDFSADPIHEVKTDRTIHGRPVYSIAENAEELEGHMIAIVGAQKTDKEEGIVYFIDPTIGSDPKKPHKLYSVSYNWLNDRIYSLLAANPGDIVPSPMGYAWTRRQ